MSGKKCKYTAPNGQEYECKPSIICGDCEHNTVKPAEQTKAFMDTFSMIKYDGHEYEAYKDGVISPRILILAVIHPVQHFS